MEKGYWVVVRGHPRERSWVCRLKLTPDPNQIGRIIIDPKTGKDAETSFEVLEEGKSTTLLEARPATGRTHQIRVHLAAAGYSVVGDPLYSSEGDPKPSATSRTGLGLRAMRLAYRDPFTKRSVMIQASGDEFLRRFGYAKRAL